MKHFSFEFNPKEIPESFEERVNVLRQIGKEAKQEFEKKYHQLSSWFKDYDAFICFHFPSIISWLMKKVGTKK